MRAGLGPALVLLHSIRTQLDLFQRVLPKLTSYFTVYAFDFRDSAGRTSCRVPTIGNRRCGSMSSISSKDSICATSLWPGESMGATLALTAAAVLGDRMKQVVAFNPYDYLPGVERANLLASVIIKSVRAPVIGPAFAAMESRASLAGILKGGLQDPRNMPPDFLDELVKGGKRPGYSNVARAVYKGLPSYVAARSHYAQIDVPVTLVYGDHDWSRPAEREANRARIKHAKMIVLKDADTLLRWRGRTNLPEF